jgi:hypothetical protein
MTEMDILIHCDDDPYRPLDEQCAQCLHNLPQKECVVAIETGKRRSHRPWIYFHKACHNNIKVKPDYIDRIHVLSYINIPPLEGGIS